MTRRVALFVAIAALAVVPAAAAGSGAFVPDDPLAAKQWYLGSIHAFDYWTGIVTGLARMSTVSSGGKAATFAGLTAGAWFGEGSVLKSEPRRYDVVALRDTIDGRALLKIPPGTSNGQKFRLREKGVLNSRKGIHGDQIVEVTLAAPKVKDERTKEILRELAQLNPEDPRAQIWEKV